MKATRATLTRLWQSSEQLAGELVCQQELAILPGQYLVMHHDDETVIIPDTCFAIQTDHLQLQVAPVPDHIHPGSQVILRGSFGHGFHVPQKSKKVALIAWDHHPNRLLYLMQTCLSTQKEVLLVWDEYKQDSDFRSIPDDVEILSQQNLADAIQWADYLALDCPLDRVHELAPHHSLLVAKSKVNPVQVLLSTAMPCLGLAECGVCATRLKKEFKLVCKDGPVFNFLDLSLDKYPDG